MPTDTKGDSLLHIISSVPRCHVHASMLTGHGPDADPLCLHAFLLPLKFGFFLLINIWGFPLALTLFGKH